MSTIAPPTPSRPEKTPTIKPTSKAANTSNMRSPRKQFQVSSLKFQGKTAADAPALQRDPSGANGKQRSNRNDRPQHHALQQRARTNFLQRRARNSGAD